MECNGSIGRGAIPPGGEVMKMKAGHNNERKIRLRCRVRDDGPKMYPTITRCFEPHMIYEYPGFSKVAFNWRSNGPMVAMHPLSILTRGASVTSQ